MSGKPGKTIGSGRMIVVDPTRGLSGDMLLACLFALGAKPAEVAKEVGKLPGLEPFRIVFGRVKRHGIAAHRARVVCKADVKERDLESILRMIRRSKLDPRVKKLAAAAFDLLGEVEGAIHGVPAKNVHFHEVGAVDSIVDIVGAVVALSQLGFPPLYHRPFRLGSGTVSTSHGDLPVPAPATLAILEGRTVRLTGDTGEIVTPTGAALIRTMAEEISS
ncbi:MAG: LarC family nickel insertion protein, partial [Candidatus Krumholzibacteria bacterium]|nr:LarC family nickel insertion protein [Candidatus Krumholzibacteria bacterium]